MPSIKTLTSLVLVIITVLIVTVILTRVSQPTEVKAVESVYNQFFGEVSSGGTRDYLTLENDKLLLHVKRLPENAVLTLLTFPPTRENNREYTKQPSPIYLSLPEPFLTVYALGIQQGNDWTVQRYIFINPHGSIPFSRIEEGITTALRHGASIETLRSIFSHYTLKNAENEASLAILLQPLNTGVCTPRAPIRFETCTKQDKTRLFTNKLKYEEDTHICLTRVWNGKMPRGITCSERDYAREEYQYAARLLLLLALLDRIGLKTIPDPKDCSLKRRIRPYEEALKTSVRIVSPERRDEIRHTYEFYTSHVTFSSSRKAVHEESCEIILPLGGEMGVWRIR